MDGTPRDNDISKISNFKTIRLFMKFYPKEDLRDWPCHCIKKKLLKIAPEILKFAQPVWLKLDQFNNDSKKILFVYGGWEGHEPEKMRDLIVPWLESEGHTVTVSPSLDSYLDKKLMKKLDLVLQIYTMSEITEDQEKGLLKAVRDRGVSLAGWHGGLGDAFRKNVEYQFMVGGQWVSHPGGIIDYTVNIIDHDDPITRGLKD